MNGNAKSTDKSLNAALQKFTVSGVTTKFGKIVHDVHMERSDEGLIMILLTDSSHSLGVSDEAVATLARQSLIQAKPTSLMDC